MATPRAFHTVTPLPDGRVLVVGGSVGSERLASVEVWDPSTGAFVGTGSMSEAHSGHTATALPDGRVLIAGGVGEGDRRLATSEIWDPSTGTFTPTGSLTVARRNQPRSSTNATRSGR